MSAEDTNEIERRFGYRPPTPEKVKEHEAVRGQVKTLAHSWMASLPNGREKAVALTTLQDALMWANAAIATATSKEA